MDSNERIFQIIYHNDEVTWQSLLYELVKREEMNPWDIDISLLAKRYIDTIKKMKELDLRVSGKMLLASCILLRVKSNRLLNEDLSELDRLLSDSEEESDGLDLTEQQYDNQNEIYQIIPRMPQPRKRKVSIFDLVNALEKALEVKRRRVLNFMPPINIEIPRKTIDISKAIKDAYVRIKMFFSRNSQSTLTFNKLLPSTSKEDKIFTFIPLLHLATEGKIDLKQEQHFGEIEVMLATKKELNKKV